MFVDLVVRVRYAPGVGRNVRVERAGVYTDERSSRLTEEVSQRPDICARVHIGVSVRKC